MMLLPALGIFRSGTRYQQAQENGWLRDANLIADTGVQVSSLEYPDLSHEDIFRAVDRFYKNFYFRPSKIGEITFEMLKSWDMTKRRLREGVEFFQFLYGRKDAA